MPEISYMTVIRPGLELYELFAMVLCLMYLDVSVWWYCYTYDKYMWTA